METLNSGRKVESIICQFALRSEVDVNFRSIGFSPCKELQTNPFHLKSLHENRKSVVYVLNIPNTRFFANLPIRDWSNEELYHHHSM